ncbi:MAG: Bcr/CflA family efflux MFS transporter [Selenomonas sp.]|uniref:Bcr/CflA family efflux MFS transporter n=1 Tax=Selenomonas sp. TaxID=2053611 RepID=UPI0025D82EE8|nr:Bcr/CflA family efflux MFS transporter [Selenomonas sp.]MCR5757471.1 Bcr/CflA family efflux MFS transporter [Selenomonas sp.]
MITQKYLSTPVLVGFITFMNMFIPLSTDLYLPALPEMGDYFGANSFLVGLTLSSFFVFFAISIVFFGPVSDKYGRKPVLIGSAVLYTLASLLCALSGNVYMLIGGRILQAVGAGAIITVATALIKECFSDSLMTRILAISQALGVIAPMCAPIIGGMLLTFTSWQGAFYLLTALGCVNILLACLLTDPLPAEKRYQDSLIASFSLLGQLLKYRRFMQILLMFSLLAAPYMAYLAVSSFVYIEQFQLSAQQYSYYFAVNSAAAVVGPILYLRLKSSFSNNRLIGMSFAFALASAMAVMLGGPWGALYFLLAFLPFTIIESMVRPFSMDILLREMDRNVGTAAAMINFVQTFLGSVGMLAGTLPWPDFIQGLGYIMIGFTGLGIFFWRTLPR